MAGDVREQESSARERGREGGVETVCVGRGGIVQASGGMGERGGGRGERRAMRSMETCVCCRVDNYSGGRGEWGCAGGRCGSWTKSRSICGGCESGVAGGERMLARECAVGVSEVVSVRGEDE